MFVVDGNRVVLPFTAQGERGLASVRGPGDRRHYVHRLVAFNTASAHLPGSTRRPWGNPRALPCTRKYETHHYPDNFRRGSRPWKNSCRANMVVLSRTEHRRWHDDHPGVVFREDNPNL